MKETVQNHEERIQILEETDKKHEERLRAIENNYTDLENTILKENRDTRSFFQDIMNKQWDLINSKNQYDDAQNQRMHDLSKTKIERWSEIILKLAGAGGLLYLVIEALMK
ncbi:hypothetical protein [Pseudobacillus badius]|uniref:hypothetical protein n=1 Tax=Bacillus badius TaxID=1455 RepID=UPI002554013E|nr:hypothetical protein [Bacillus badius]